MEVPGLVMGFCPIYSLMHFWCIVSRGLECIGNNLSKTLAVGYLDYMSLIVSNKVNSFGVTACCLRICRSNRSANICFGFWCLVLISILLCMRIVRLWFASVVNWFLCWGGTQTNIRISPRDTIWGTDSVSHTSW